MNQGHHFPHVCLGPGTVPSAFRALSRLLSQMPHCEMCSVVITSLQRGGLKLREGNFAKVTQLVSRKGWL